MPEPDMPASIELSIEDALLLIVALEDAAAVLTSLLQGQQLQGVDLLGPLAGIEHQLATLEGMLGWRGDPNAQ